MFSIKYNKIRIINTNHGRYTVLTFVDTKVPSTGSLPKQRSRVQLASPGTDHRHCRRHHHHRHHQNIKILEY